MLYAIAGLAFGTAIPQPCTPAPAAPAPPHPLFLWKVTGGKGTVFLLGSLHAAKADFYPLPRPIEAAFAQSAVLVEEIDLVRQDPAHLRRMVLEKGLYPPDDRLDNHISAETKHALQKYLKRTGQDPATFSRMKPWLVAVLVGGAVVASDGISSKYGIDEHFAREAAATHKRLGALESARSQLDLLSNLPAPLQEAMLLSSLRDAQQGEREIATLLDAWRSGDAKPIEELIARDEREYPRLKPVYDVLLPARNRRMVEKIAAYLATPNTYFVVVGVGHLVGEHSIVDLLRDRRYAVERVGAE
ncbi:MAG TPA: TraB/GumN family protein [Stellaceae bacterium]|nr:TraB/GumN family protein [Stellaceae bacterium]